MRKIHPLWGALTALLFEATIALCFAGSVGGTLYVYTPSDPQETVTGFFDALKEGSTDDAYALLDNYESLGLENKPQTENGQLLMDALLKSYDYSLVGECRQSGVEAEQTVLLTALDLSKVAEGRVQALTGDGEASDGEQKPALSVREVLEENPDLKTTAEYTVKLRYTKGQWRIVLDDALMYALAGGM